jgi:hypothetical protein
MQCAVSPALSLKVGSTQPKLPVPSCVCRWLSCRNALAAYQEALAYAPNNSIAMQRMDYCKTRVERLGL